MYVCAVAIDVGEKGISIEEDDVPAENTCNDPSLSLARYYSSLVAAVVLCAMMMDDDG
jgi:hypothetical protein